jgi:hypothetical protein
MLAVALLSRTRLGDQQAPAALVAHQGRLVAAAVVVLTLAQLAVAYALAGRRIRVQRWIVPVSALACCLVPVVAATIFVGSLGDRPAYWRAAWADTTAHPLLGSGPGSFEVAWLHYRTVPVATRSAHSLYLETLSELGPLGLMLLVLALATPLVVAVRMKGERSSATVAAAGAYFAFIAHAALDWDWQMPVVVVAALVSAAVLIVPKRLPRGDALAPWRLGGWLLATVLVWIAASAGLAATTALATGIRAASRGDLVAAASSARSASRLEPWSAEPHVFQGDVELARRDPAAARREFETAAQLDPSDWQTWVELAQFVNGRERRAALMRAEALNPLAFHAR